MSKSVTVEDVIGRVPDWNGRNASVELLHGGLANLNYAVRVDGKSYFVKLLSHGMEEFGLGVPVDDLIQNTVAAGRSRVGAEVLQVFPELPAMILEYIDGRTITTEDMKDKGYIQRVGQAVRRLHDGADRFRNEFTASTALDRWLNLVHEHALRMPDGVIDALSDMRDVHKALAVNALPQVPSHDDLYAPNIMDDGKIRLVDYDFSGMNDPCFDIGDYAMEGRLEEDEIDLLCESYFGEPDPIQSARVRLFGIAAEYIWVFLFVAMDQLGVTPAADTFDYWGEAVIRWDWTRAQLEGDDLGRLIDAARSMTPS